MPQLPVWAQAISVIYLIGFLITSLVVGGLDFRWGTKVLLALGWPITWLATFAYTLMNGIEEQ